MLEQVFFLDQLVFKFMIKTWIKQLNKGLIEKTFKKRVKTICTRNFVEKM